MTLIDAIRKYSSATLAEFQTASIQGLPAPLAYGGYDCTYFVIGDDSYFSTDMAVRAQMYQLITTAIAAAAETTPAVRPLNERLISKDGVDLSNSGMQYMLGQVHDLVRPNLTEAQQPLWDLVFVKLAGKGPQLVSPEAAAGLSGTTQEQWDAAQAQISAEQVAAEKAVRVSQQMTEWASINGGMIERIQSGEFATLAEMKSAPAGM